MEIGAPNATAIGSPTSCIKVCTFVSNDGGSMVLNQVLGPLPPGTCDLGAASGVDFSAIAGSQYFTVCSQIAVPARAASWGRLKLVYR